MGFSRLTFGGMLGLFVWFSVVIASLLARTPLAKRFYDALPVESPASYGDCLVVSAAAMDHPRFVGSRFDPQSGITINLQLLRLWAPEQLLASPWPVAHRSLRRWYDAIGPALVRRIAPPFCRRRHVCRVEAAGVAGALATAELEVRFTHVASLAKTVQYGTALL